MVPVRSFFIGGEKCKICSNVQSCESNILTLKRFPSNFVFDSILFPTSEGVGDGDAERPRAEHGDGPGSGERQEAEGAEGQEDQELAHGRRRLGHGHRRGGRTRVPSGDAGDASGDAHCPAQGTLTLGLGMARHLCPTTRP